jgi:hypothetical protein
MLDEVDTDVVMFMKMVRQIREEQLPASECIGELQVVMRLIDHYPESVISEVTETVFELVSKVKAPGWLELASDVLSGAGDEVFEREVIPQVDLICSFLPYEYSLRLLRRAIAVSAEPLYGVVRKLCDIDWDRDQLSYVLIGLRDFVRGHGAEPIAGPLHELIVSVPWAPRLSLCVIEIAGAMGDYETVNSRLRSGLRRGGAPLQMLESVFRVAPSGLGEDEEGSLEEAILERLGEYPWFVGVYLETLWRAEEPAWRVWGEERRSEALRESCVSALRGPFEVKSEVVWWLWRWWLRCEGSERARVLGLSVFLELVEQEFPADLEAEIREGLAGQGYCGEVETEVQ